MSKKHWYELTEQDREFFGSMGGFELVPAKEHIVMPDSDEPGIEDMKFRLSRAYIEQGPDAYIEFLIENRELLEQMAVVDPEVATVAKLGLMMGMDDGHAGCACYLGALFYMGHIVPQDCQRAVELYLIAKDMGSLQAILNLGYVYQYGRIGEPDYRKAFEMYSLANAIEPHFETVCKMGDMYAAGQFVEASEDLSATLWQRSYDMCDGKYTKGMPALRIAQHILNPLSCVTMGKKELIHALKLFQEAEHFYRVEVCQGSKHYAGRLQEAVEGQRKVRELLDCM